MKHSEALSNSASTGTAENCNRKTVLRIQSKFSKRIKRLDIPCWIDALICFKRLILKCFFFIQLPSSFVFLSVGPLTISNVSFSSLWTWRNNWKNYIPFMKHFMLCQVIRLLYNCTNNWSFISFHIFPIHFLLIENYGCFQDVASSWAQWSIHSFTVCSPNVFVVGIRI